MPKTKKPMTPDENDKLWYDYLMWWLHKLKWTGIYLVFIGSSIPVAMYALSYSTNEGVPREKEI
ncbi:MAG: hypothetical protein FWE67_16080, partial [Planctomycetaceae bacterium]|nr:hypothetical protein [Planctomycetaceae bacterium]